MSPDSSSCSTRCGSGVCGGGDQVGGRVVVRAGRPGSPGVASPSVWVSVEVAAPAPLLAARGRSRAPGCRTPGRPARRRGRRGAGRGAGCARRSRAGRTRRPGCGRASGRGAPQLDRHLVDRRRGDHQDAEEREQQQQRHHDVRRAEQVEQQARDDVPDRAAGVLQVRGVAVDRLRGCRRRCARCRARRTPRATQPTTWRPAGPLVSGSRMVRQPTQTRISGTSQPTLPTEPATTVRTPSISPPGSCHQTAAATTTREPEQEQADAVATVLGLEVAGGPPDLARDGADGVGDAEPDRGDAAAERAEQAQRPDRAPSGRLGAPATRACGRSRS